MKPADVMHAAAGQIRRERPTAWHAARDFLRGFVGLAAAGTTTSPGSPHAARAALTQRAASRKSCC